MMKSQKLLGYPIRSKKVICCSIAFLVLGSQKVTLNDPSSWRGCCPYPTPALIILSP